MWTAASVDFGLTQLCENQLVFQIEFFFLETSAPTGLNSEKLKLTKIEILFDFEKSKIPTCKCPHVLVKFRTSLSLV